METKSFLYTTDALKMEPYMCLVFRKLDNCQDEKLLSKSSEEIAAYMVLVSETGYRWSTDEVKKFLAGQQYNF